MANNRGEPAKGSRRVTPADTPSTRRVSFDNLDSTEFEEFCYELLVEQGFHNVDWRKGTPKPASPADRGRDLVAHMERLDVDGHRYAETWFADCKHYTRGVPPEALQGLFTWAEADRPDVVLIIASGYLSNPAKDWIDHYEKTRRPPFRTRHWEKPELSRMLVKHPTLVDKYGIIIAGASDVATQIKIGAITEIAALLDSDIEEERNIARLVLRKKADAGDDLVSATAKSLLDSHAIVESTSPVEQPSEDFEVVVADAALADTLAYPELHPLADDAGNSEENQAAPLTSRMRFANGNVELRLSDIAAAFGTGRELDRTSVTSRAESSASAGPLRSILKLSWADPVAVLVPVLSVEDSRSAISIENMYAVESLTRALIQSYPAEFITPRSVVSVEVADSFVGSDRRNVIAIAGPDQNPLTAAVLGHPSVRNWLDCCFAATHDEESRRVLRLDGAEFASPSYAQEAEILRLGQPISAGKLIDYALVASLTNPWNPKARVVLAAGIRAFGTWGAAEFIRSSADSLARRAAGRDFAYVVKVVLKDFAIASVLTEIGVVAA